MRTTHLIPLALLASCSEIESTPPTTIEESLAGLGLTTLDTAVEAAALDDDLTTGGPFTLFAPTDAAFTALPAGFLDDLLLPANQADLIALLEYHLLAATVLSPSLLASSSATTVETSDVLLDFLGSALYVNEGFVLLADIEATNGAIHGIDRVLRPPVPILTALDDRGFSELATAIDTAGLTTTLSGPGPFTLFAPTDAALIAAAGTTSGLTPTELADLLLYHVVNGSVRASVAVAAGTLTSQNADSDPLAIAAAGNTFTVDANVVQRFNIPCTNGVIHVIDAVLSPPPGATAAPGVVGSPISGSVATERGASQLTLDGSFDPHAAVLWALVGDGATELLGPDEFTSVGANTYALPRALVPGDVELLGVDRP